MQIDVPMPAQGFNDEMDVWDYLQTLTKTVWDSPEKYLCAEVLKDAVKVYTEAASIYGGSPKESISNQKKQRARQTKRWLMGDDDEQDPDYPFSFVSICETLGIEPSWLRARILKFEIKK